MTKRTRKSTKPKGNGHATAPEKAGLSAKVPGKDRAESVFKTSYVRLCGKMAQLGATDSEIAEALGIATRTLYRWKIAHTDLAAAMVVGKKAPDERVKRSLYQCAVGYSYEAEKPFVDKDGGEHVVKYIEHVQPNPVSCFFWLKNREPEEWRDRQEHVHELVTTPDMLREAQARITRLPSIVAEIAQRAAQ